MGTLLGGRPNQGITHTQVADITGASHTTLTERRLVDSVIGDTVDVNNCQPYMAAMMSPSRQARHERGEKGVLEANARLITRSYPGEERASATLETGLTDAKSQGVQASSR